MRSVMMVALAALVATPASAQDMGRQIWGEALAKANSVSARADVACDAVLKLKDEAKAQDDQLMETVERIATGIERSNTLAVGKASEQLGTQMRESQLISAKRGYAAAYCEMLMAEEEKASK